MEYRRVFYDGKPQARAAARLGAAFINPVEALEDLGLLLGGDTDAGIAHAHKGSVLAVRAA